MSSRTLRPCVSGRPERRRSKMPGMPCSREPFPPLPHNGLAAAQVTGNFRVRVACRRGQDDPGPHHQPLRALGEMAYSVLAAVERRQPTSSAVVQGRYMRPWADATTVAVPIAERPPVNPGGLSRILRLVAA